MFNNTSATLMLQTIMVLMEKQNSLMDVTNLPSNTFQDDTEVEKCYGIYGCFSVSYPWVTDTRPVNLFPSPPDGMKVRYPVFTRRNMRTPLIIDPEDIHKIQNSNMDPRGPFYLISHGYMESGSKLWIEKMANALLVQEGNAAATVIIVDWRGGSNPPYTQAVANIRLVGVITAHLIYHIYTSLGLTSLDNFHFIGHSLGSHLGGYCGHALQKKFGLKLGRITGLDPAEPHFAKTVSLVRLDRSDAKYVDIIHTDATSFIRGGFGISESIGHVDFFPNGGHDQPGCNKDVMGIIRSEQNSVFRGIRRYVSCNHVRSYEYFTESISPSCPFMAIQCPSYETFLGGNCSKCDNYHHCIPLGFHSHKSYSRLLAAGLVDVHTSLGMFSMTGDGKEGSPYCRTHLKVAFKVSDSEINKQGGEVGQLSLVLIDRLGNQSEPILLDTESKYHKPGSITTMMVAARDTGLAPVSAILNWKYETNLLNPLTWRLASSPSIYIDYMKISSLEYNTDITVCPKDHSPVVANLPSLLQTVNCPITQVLSQY